MIRGFALVVLVCSLYGQSLTLRIDVVVTDSERLPVSGARLQLTSDRGVDRTAETDDLGHVGFLALRPGRFSVSATKAGFEPLVKPDIVFDQPGTAKLELTLTPTLARTESVEVRGTVMAVEDNASTPNTLPAKKVKELPNRPATVADALPLIPGVVREPTGGLILSSSPENRAALIVNSADVTDPATGQFGLTVPIDSVEVMSVYQTAYLAEYGRFTAGLISVETKRGGDRWKWEINDPLPEFFIRSWHLRGLRTATPRLNFEGPLIKNRLFISEGAEYETKKTTVFTLPFPFNQKKQQGFNTFTQLDWVVSARQLITATVHLAPQRFDALNLDYFNPQSTSPDARTHNYTGTVADRLTLAGGLLETRFSTTQFYGDVWGRGTDDLVLSPTGNSGSYFAEQTRSARRISGAVNYSFAPIKSLGNHQFKIGAYIASSEHDGDITRHPVDIVDNSKRLLERITFTRTRSFEVDDTEKSFFGEDHWILSPRFALDYGVRTESQQISGAFRVGPRGGFSWAPAAESGPVIRGGFGLFYDRVPLNVYGFNRYPNRVVTFYDAQGVVSSGPFLYLNTLGQSRVRFPFVSQRPVDGNFSPRSTIWSLQVEQAITRKLKVRATFLKNDADGLVVLNTVQPDPETGLGAYLMEGSGESSYRQFDILALWHLRDDRELFMSYTRSSARGDINDFGRFLGTAPVPIIRPNYRGTLPTDLPNRFLAWGVFRLPRKFQIAPVMEYRSGFPYLETDAYQDYAGIPYRHRFPTFLSLDARVSKDLKINPKYSIRLSVSSFNLTNHFNPEAVHGNVSDPAFGYFFGHRGRHFTADFDFLF